MSDWFAFRSHAGVRVAQQQPGYLLADQVATPTCDKHEDVGLIMVDAPEPLRRDLNEESELWVCPECFPAEFGNEIDEMRLAREIAENWSDYKEHFTDERKPELDVDTTFEFR